MSYATTVILTFSIEELDHLDRCPALDSLNHWLTHPDRDRGQLADVSKYFGGTLPAPPVFAANFNHFPTEEFLAFLFFLPWEHPEEIQVFIREEDDDLFRLVTMPVRPG